MSEEKVLVRFDPSSVKSQRRVAGVVAGTAYGLFRTASKLEVQGVENLPQHSPAIIAAYHANHLDPILVGLAIWRNGKLPHFLAKSTLFTGALGKVLGSIGQIPVLRASAQAGDSLEYAKKALASNEVVVIYPEGTLTKDPELWPQHFKSGTARLALETGAPIIPVAHWGLEEVYPHGSKLPRFKPRRHTSVVRFGAPIDYRDLWEQRDSKKSKTILTRRLTNIIAHMVAELSGRQLPEKFHTEEVGE